MDWDQNFALKKLVYFLTLITCQFQLKTGLFLSENILLVKKAYFKIFNNFSLSNLQKFQL